MPNGLTGSEEPEVAILRSLREAATREAAAARRAMSATCSRWCVQHLPALRSAAAPVNRKPAERCELMNIVKSPTLQVVNGGSEPSDDRAV